MKKILLPLLSLGVLAMGIAPVTAQTLFLTGRGTTIRTSTDGAATWSTFATVSGGQLRGIDAGNVGGSNYVFTNNLNAGTNLARPLLAYNASGTQVASTTYNNNGAFNEQPIGYFGGYVYGSSGGTPQNFYTSFNGTAFGTVADSGVGGWQGNNIAFASSGGTNYLYTSGAGGSAFRRNAITNTGAVTTNTTNTTTTGGPADLRDIAFTSSGRLLTIGTTGIFLSGMTQQTSNSISLTSAFSFSATENALTGDMGANARDFALVGSTLFAVTDTRVFSYSLNDTTGALTFNNAYTHGFNSTGVQITGIAAVPEPTTTFVVVIGGLVALIVFRRRRQVA